MSGKLYGAILGALLALTTVGIAVFEQQCKPQGVEIGSFTDS